MQRRDNNSKRNIARFRGTPQTRWNAAFRSVRINTAYLLLKTITKVRYNGIMFLCICLYGNSKADQETSRSNRPAYI